MIYWTATYIQLKMRQGLPLSCSGFISIDWTWLLSVSIELTWIKLDPIRLDQLFNFKVDWMLTVVNLTHLHPLDPSVLLVTHQNSPCCCCSKKTPKKRGKILGWKKRPPVVHVGGQAGVTLQNSFHMKWGMPYMPILPLCMESFHPLSQLSIFDS